MNKKKNRFFFKKIINILLKSNHNSNNIRKNIWILNILKSADDKKTQKKI